MLEQFRRQETQNTSFDIITFQHVTFCRVFTDLEMFLSVESAELHMVLIDVFAVEFLL
jgi:hypothetical protein